MITAPTHQHADDLVRQGYQWVAGVDEVGRGCWAGPVVAAAVILPATVELPGVTDSKLLSHRRRVHLARQIKQASLAVGLGWVAAPAIDAHGLTQAVSLAARQALTSLDHSYDAVLLDGNHNYLQGHCHTQTIIKGDRLSLSIAAASIIAKVARDHYMMAQHRLYPAYGFHQNKGYGTPRHAAAVQESVSPLHRRLFKPVQLAAGGFFEFLDYDVHD